MIVSGHGIEVPLPRGWSGRLFSRAAGVATLHAGDFPLALQDGEFGDRSTGRMPAPSSFLALTEYRAGAGLEPGTGLFAARGLALPLDPADFSARRLQHARPGQTGTQQFFTAAGRPFCLYVVVAGTRLQRRERLLRLGRVLAGLTIRPRSGALAGGGLRASPRSPVD